MNKCDKCINTVVEVKVEGIVHLQYTSFPSVTICGVEVPKEKREERKGPVLEETQCLLDLLNEERLYYKSGNECLEGLCQKGLVLRIGYTYVLSPAGEVAAKKLKEEERTHEPIPHPCGCVEEYDEEQGEVIIANKCERHQLSEEVEALPDKSFRTIGRLLLAIYRKLDYQGDK